MFKLYPIVIWLFVELAVDGNQADIAELLKMPKREDVAAVGPMGDASEKISVEDRSLTRSTPYCRVR